jgi:hypothetical protein
MISGIDLGCEVGRFKENAPARAVAGASGFRPLGLLARRSDDA